MKKQKKHLTIAAALLAVSCTAAAFGAVLAQDYSTTDPLISKSYLDNVFMTQVADYVDAHLASADSSRYEVVTLTKGQILIAETSLEFILRPGSSATVYSPVSENGIANLTDGTEMYDEDEIPINAYCLIPRGDGRGIVCTSDIAYVMVRGCYGIA